MVRQEPPELVALRCGLGDRLAAARRAAEVGQQQLAHKTGYSRSSVSHAEAGRQLLTRDFWQIADELLKADGALLAGYEQVRAAKQKHERQSREAELAGAYAAAVAQRATSTPSPGHDADGSALSAEHNVVAGLVASAAEGGLAKGLAGPLMYLAFLDNAEQIIPGEWEDQVCDQFVKFLRAWANTMKRRKLLWSLGCAATTVAASPVRGLDIEKQERLAQATAVPSRVDAQVIDHIEAMLHHCKRQHDTLGPQAVLHTVLAQRQLVSSLLKNCSSALRPRLLSVYSNMSSSAAFYFFDLDDVDSAMYYCDQARAAAQGARNTGLAVYALCNMSYFASWQGKAHAGIDFAAAAQSLASKTDDVLLRVCVAERVGTAYAVDGQYKECMTEFERAQAWLESSAGQTSPESPAYWYHMGFIASKQSHCLLRLGKPQEAASRASAGLQLFDGSFVGSLAFCTLRLGTAHLLSTEVEEAARVIGDGALLIAKAPSARLAKELRTVRTRMQSWAGTQAVKELDERLSAYGLMFERDSRALG